VESFFSYFGLVRFLKKKLGFGLELVSFRLDRFEKHCSVQILYLLTTHVMAEVE